MSQPDSKVSCTCNPFSIGTDSVLSAFLVSCKEGVSLTVASRIQDINRGTRSGLGAPCLAGAAYLAVRKLYDCVGSVPSTSTGIGR